MEFKKSTIPTNTTTRTLSDFDAETGNIYGSIVGISRRANQIGSEIKEELVKKLSEFNTTTDTLEETFENREQIEVSRYYERLPKPVLIAVEEYLDGDLNIKHKEVVEKLETTEEGL
ncbi:MAG: DNA-directed RNA polymerase subunit omega [Rikenellaceae bacterium]